MLSLLRNLTTDFPRANLLGVWYPDVKQFVLYSEDREEHAAANYLLHLVGSYFDPNEPTQTRHVVISGNNQYHVLMQLPGGLVLLFGHDFTVKPERFVGTVSDAVLRLGVNTSAGVLSRAALREPQVPLTGHERRASTQQSRLQESLLSAQRSQTQLLSDVTPIRPYVQNLAVLYSPKDFVGGDFYYFQPNEDGFWFALADYTGHGIEGAMGAMMCSSLLSHVMASRAVLSPTQVLLRLHQSLVRMVGNSTDKANRQPGLEMLFGQFVASSNRLQLCSAGIETMIVRDGHTLEAPRMRFALGSQAFDESSLIPYEHEVKSGDVLAFFTDGLKDQLDPTGHRRIGRKRIQQLVQENSNGRFAKLDQEVRTAVNAWRGPAEQTDDMSLIGIKF